jgi:hypothetical protein
MALLIFRSFDNLKIFFGHVNRLPPFFNGMEEPVRKRKLADEELAVDNTPVKKSKVESNTPVADFLIFGSGDQGNQLPLELTKTVKFRRKPAVVKQFENCKIRQVSERFLLSPYLLTN